MFGWVVQLQNSGEQHSSVVGQACYIGRYQSQGSLMTSDNVDAQGVLLGW